MKLQILFFLIYLRICYYLYHLEINELMEVSDTYIVFLEAHIYFNILMMMRKSSYRRNSSFLTLTKKIDNLYSEMWYKLIEMITIAVGWLLELLLSHNFHIWCVIYCGIYRVRIFLKKKENFWMQRI